MQFDRILKEPISLKTLELITIDLPQKTTFKSAIGIRTSRRALIIKWIDKEGNYGFGECSCRPDPYYSSEFLEGSGLLVQNFLFPLIKDCTTYEAFLAAMQKVRGWPFTKAALEFALNDLLLRKNGTDILSVWDGERLDEVPVGISLGIQDNYQALEKKAEESVALGYSRLKFKINPASQVEDFKKLQQKYPAIYLSFDANGSFYEKDIPVLKEFATLNAMVEQPFPPHRLDLAAIGRAAIPELFVCLDESIKNISDLKVAHQLNLLDEVNLKPGRVGGLYNSLLILDYCKENQLPCWIGGMFETGIGRTANLRVAACLPLAKAHDLSPSHRYFLEDIIAEPIQMTENGNVLAKDLSFPSIGFGNLEKYTDNKLTITNS